MHTRGAGAAARSGAWIAENSGAAQRHSRASYAAMISQPGWVEKGDGKGYMEGGREGR
jgi:hypothetical protein